MFFVLDLHENAKNNSKKIKVVSAIVLALSELLVVKYSKENKPKTIIVATMVVVIMNPFVPESIVSFDERGFRFIISFSAGSLPKANAGSPSVTRLTHNICNGSSGSGNEKSSEKKITDISPRFAESKNFTNFFILS